MFQVIKGKGEENGMKKYRSVFLLLLLFLGMTTLGMRSDAMEQKELPSQGSVGFHGSYEQPKLPTESSESITDIPRPSSNKPVSTGNRHGYQGSSFLPQTGEEKQMMLLIIGAALVCIVLLLIIKKQRKEEKK